MLSIYKKVEISSFLYADLQGDTGRDDEAGNKTTRLEKFFRKVPADRRAFETGKGNIIEDMLNGNKKGKKAKETAATQKTTKTAKGKKAKAGTDIMSETLNGADATNGPGFSTVAAGMDVQDDMVNGEENSTVAPLNRRVTGDRLLDAQDLIEEVKSNGGEVD